ncbi:MAG: site-specific integrase [Kiritimatiellae bacterium]|nr:site-specific integrase [Verrucomicrobiota bacterium]MBU4290733.1 site-specific integrase [Verrucomicrobiota bacterium]MCG2679751.1 site-specific integrase [Kiritimatiellia bacterium]
MKKRTGYLIRRGKVFYAAWNIAGKRYVQTTGKRDRREAETRLAEIMEPYLVEDEVKTLQSIKARIEGRTADLTRLEDERNPPLTFISAWDAYLNGAGRPDSGERTLADYEGYFDAFAAWMKETHPAGLALRDVTPPIASEYAAHLAGARKLSGNSFNKRVRFMELLFRVLKEPARLAVNPWESIGRKRQLPQGRRELTIDELRRVCSTATGELRPLLAIGIYTGLRLGDCATLRWGEVDLQRGIILRIANKTATRNPKPIHIPIHPALRAILKDLPKDGKGDYVLPANAALYRDNRPELSRRIQELFEQNGITTTKPGTGQIKTTDEKGKVKIVHSGKRAVVEVGFHSLRHTFVSMCRAANAPLSVVESIVGHSNPAMTRHYTHTSDLAAASAVNSLPVVMGGTSTPALPPAKMIDAAPVHALGDMLNGKNWRTVKKELLKLSK